MDDVSREELYRRLEEKDMKLDEAGRFGKQLLESNRDLAEKYETDVEDFNKRIESLEQAKYTLQMQLEAKDHMEKHYEAELASASDRAKREVAAVTERLQMTHTNELQKLKSYVNTLKEDLELCRLKESQQQEKVKSLEERLESADEVNNRTFTNLTSCMEEQVSSLAEQNTQLQAEKLQLTDELKESEEIRKQQTLMISSTKQQLEELQEQSDDQHKQCISYQRALEDCKERLEETQAEMELLKLESQDPNRKGNSLFAEVEVRRQETEKRFISLKIQHDAMKRRATFHKQRVQELKLQVAHLLLTDDSRVSVSRIREVQSDLARTQQQNQLLVKKIRDLEDNYTIQPKNEKHATTSYHEEQARKECEKLQEDLHKERMMRIASEVKETEYKKKLYDANMEINRTKAQLMKIEIKNSDLKEKLASGQSGQQTEVVQASVGRLEKIPLDHLPKRNAEPTDPGSENKENIGDTSPSEEHVGSDSSQKGSPEERVSDTFTGGAGEGERRDHGMEAENGHSEGNGNGEGPVERGNELTENRSPLTDRGLSDGSTRKRQNGTTRGRHGTASNGKKGVSISDQVEVIGSEDTVDQSTEEAGGHEATIESPSKAKRSRGKGKKSNAPVIHVKSGEQNECKQQ